MNISKLNKFLILILIILISYFIRIYPHIGFSPISGTYEPGVQYGTFNVVYNGFIQEFTLSNSYTTNLINGGLWLGEYARYTFNPIILILIGKTSLLEMTNIYKYFLWQGVILMPLAALVLFHQLSKLYKTPVSFYHYIIVYSFASLGSTSIISVTSTGLVMDYYGWIFLLYIFYFYLKTLNSKNSTTSFLLILFVISLQLYHHTSALFCFFIFTSILLYQMIFTKHRLITINRYFMSATIFIFYVSYLTYVFDGYFTALKSSILSISHPFSVQYQLTQGVFAGITESLPLDRVIIRGMNMLFICLPVVLILLYNHKRKLNDKNVSFLMAWILSLIPSAALLIGWGGFSGFFYRFSYLLSIISIISFMYLLLFYNSKTEKYGLYLLLFLCISSSIHSYNSSDFGAGNSLTWSEYACINKINSIVHKDTPIFSDSRLASPLIYFHFNNVRGLEDEGEDFDSLTKVLIDYTILFSTDDVNKLDNNINNLTIIKGEFLILSNQFLKPSPGIHSYLNIFKPASPNYQNKFEESTHFDNVYNNGDVNLFRII